jgi:hypothetical protein
MCVIFYKMKGFLLLTMLLNVKMFRAQTCNPNPCTAGSVCLERAGSYSCFAETSKHGVCTDDNSIGPLMYSGAQNPAGQDNPGGGNTLDEVNECAKACLARKLPVAKHWLGEGNSGSTPRSLPDRDLRGFGISTTANNNNDFGRCYCEMHHIDNCVSRTGDAYDVYKFECPIGQYLDDGGGSALYDASCLMCPAGKTTLTTDAVPIEECVAPCMLNSCLNGGTCTDATTDAGIALGDFECTCAAGYEGTYCETDFDECTLNPCPNNGVCSDSTTDATIPLDSYKCDDCDPNPCTIQTGGSVCLDGAGTYSCIDPSLDIGSGSNRAMCQTCNEVADCATGNTCGEPRPAGYGSGALDYTWAHQQGCNVAGGEIQKTVTDVDDCATQCKYHVWEDSGTQKSRGFIYADTASGSPTGPDCYCEAQHSSPHPECHTLGGTKWDRYDFNGHWEADYVWAHNQQCNSADNDDEELNKVVTSIQDCADQCRGEKWSDAGNHHYTAKGFVYRSRANGGPACYCEAVHAHPHEDCGTFASPVFDRYDFIPEYAFMHYGECRGDTVSGSLDNGDNQDPIAGAHSVDTCAAACKGHTWNDNGLKVGIGFVYLETTGGCYCESMYSHPHVDCGKSTNDPAWARYDYVNYSPVFELKHTWFGTCQLDQVCTEFTGDFHENILGDGNLGTKTSDDQNPMILVTNNEPTLIFGGVGDPKYFKMIQTDFYGHMLSTGYLVTKDLPFNPSPGLDYPMVISELTVDLWNARLVPLTFPSGQLTCVGNRYCMQDFQNPGSWNQANTGLVYTTETGPNTGPATQCARVCQGAVVGGYGAKGFEVNGLECICKAEAAVAGATCAALEGCKSYDFEIAAGGVYETFGYCNPTTSVSLFSAGQSGAEEDWVENCRAGCVADTPTASHFTFDPSTGQCNCQQTTVGAHTEHPCESGTKVIAPSAGWQVYTIWDGGVTDVPRCTNAGVDVRGLGVCVLECTASSDPLKDGSDGEFYCINGGEIFDIIGSCVCICPDGFSGDHCEISLVVYTKTSKKGVCTDDDSIGPLMYSGAEAPQGQDNPGGGNTLDEVNECAKACLARKDPTGNHWLGEGAGGSTPRSLPDRDLRGFGISTTANNQGDKGRCYCEMHHIDNCVSRSGSDSYDVYKFECPIGQYLDDGGTEDLYQAICTQCPAGKTTLTTDAVPIEECLPPCMLTPCLNGGTCTDTTMDAGIALGDFVCTCEPEYDGQICQNKLCGTGGHQACLNGGTCFEEDVVLAKYGEDDCFCPSGFEGHRCERTISDTPCVLDDYLGSKYVAQVVAGAVGEWCQLDVNGDVNSYTERLRPYAGSDDMPGWATTDELRILACYRACIDFDNTQIQDTINDYQDLNYWTKFNWFDSLTFGVRLTGASPGRCYCYANAPVNGECSRGTYETSESEYYGFTIHHDCGSVDSCGNDFCKIDTVNSPSMCLDGLNTADCDDCNPCPDSHPFLGGPTFGTQYWCYTEAGNNGNVCNMANSGVFPPVLNGVAQTWGANQDDCVVETQTLPSSVPCLNGGACVDGQGNYTCTCAAGFGGDRCEIPLDCVVSLNPSHDGQLNTSFYCDNNGTIGGIVGSCFCTCVHQFSGTHCNECAPGLGYNFSKGYHECEPCPHGEVNNQTSHRAACADHACNDGYGYTSDIVTPDFSYDWDAANNSLNSGNCRRCPPDTKSPDKDGQCVFCTPGMEGLDCLVDTNECSGNPCFNGATCFDSNNYSFVPLQEHICNCTAGWKGDSCEIDIDECAANNCMNGASCAESNSNNSIAVDTYECTCTGGWQGFNCSIDTDECAVNNGSGACLNGASCAESTSDGSIAVDTYECTCAAGYEGLRCEIDIDECKAISVTTPLPFLGDYGSMRSTVTMNFDGSYLALGSPDNSNQKGYLQIFKWNINQWDEVFSQKSSTWAELGSSVALSNDGKTLVVGARVEGGNGEYEDMGEGKVDVYKFDGTNWNKLGQTIFGDHNEAAGHDVSINADGTRIALSLPHSRTYGDGCQFYHPNTVKCIGFVQIYELQLGSWVQLGSDADIVGTFTPSTLNLNDATGHAVHLNSVGDRIAVSSVEGGVDSVTGEGFVRVYEYVNSNWIQMGSNIMGEEQYDAFGSDVSISADGSILAIGADQGKHPWYFDGWGALPSGHRPGKVYVYTWINSDWQQIGTTILGPEDDSRFGHSVSLSDNGLRLAVGAPGDIDSNGYFAVYEFDGSWVKIKEVSGELSSLGVAVALSGDGMRLSVGTGSQDSGFTYFFNETYPKCENEGICTETTNGTFLAVDSFFCECPAGYEGTYCEIDIDECTSTNNTNFPSLCNVTGTDFCNTTFGPNTRNCTCIPGYEGDLCETDTNECYPDPCVNGACTQTTDGVTAAINSFHCACDFGWIGTDCGTLEKKLELLAPEANIVSWFMVVQGVAVLAFLALGVRQLTPVEQLGRFVSGKPSPKSWCEKLFECLCTKRKASLVNRPGRFTVY